MLWTAGEGYFLLARHLERLERSARYFGFDVALPAVRWELERLAARLDRTRQRVRLLVTGEGRITLEAEALPAFDSAPPRITVAPGPVDSSNPFLYHKTTNRNPYEAARAACPAYDDVLLFNERGEVTESTNGRLPNSRGLLGIEYRNIVIRPVQKQDSADPRGPTSPEPIRTQGDGGFAEAVLLHSQSAARPLAVAQAVRRESWKPALR